MQVNGKTKVYALLGKPIGHSLSPVMHNSAFNALNYNGLYIALQVEKEKMNEAVEGIRSLGILGGNVTVPHKESIIPYLDRITEEARQVGAINTYYWKNGELWGANTDGPGFINSITKKKKDVLKSKGAIIFGAGGAARAVSVSLFNNGIRELVIVNRNKDRAKTLADHLMFLGCDVSFFDWEEFKKEKVLKEYELLINTTSLGMEPLIDDMPPLDINAIRTGHFVVDIIYKPQETLLLQKAKERGCMTLNGMSMLLEQGILAFELFTGLEAPVNVMKRELERWL